MDRRDSKIYMSFVQVKLDALKENKFTDCSFLVGDDDEEQQEFNGVKSDLMMVSGFMSGIFNSPLRPEDPIRIKNVKTKTFSMIMEFAHVGRVVGTCDCIEAAELAIAADHLLIDSLKPVCIDLIQSTVTVDKVWNVLDLLLKFGLTDVASGCHKVLSEKTEMCLQEEAFLTASKESVVELLKVDLMFIASEKRLIDYCYKWAQNTNDERDSLRVLLPGLRLFTLTANEAARLPKFLTPEEDAELLRFFITKEFGTNLPEKLNICLKKRHQVKDTEQVLFTSSEYDQVRNADKWSSGYFVQNELYITTNVDIFISKLKFVHGFVNKDYNEEALLLKIKKGKDFKIEIGHQADDSTTAEVAVKISAINWSAFDLTCSVPILIKKGVPTRLVMTNHDGWSLFAHVPWSILDLTSSGDAAHKYFQQLQFKETRHPIFLQSFSHRLA